MRELESRLRAFAAQADFPATPDLAASVGARLRAEGAAPPATARRRRPSRGLAIALAAILLIPAAAVAAVPDTRNAVLEWLGLRHVEVKRTPTPLPAAPATDARLGTRTTLAAARSELDFEPLLPADLGDPSAVYVRPNPPGGRVVLVYGDVQVTELQGSDSSRYVQKMLGPGTRVERLRVGAAPGIWITGKPHGVLFADRNGQIRDDTLQLAGDTLIWERDGLVLRVEGARSKADALRIAESVG